MNSKFLYGAALSALVLASCSRESVFDAPTETDAISFTVTNGATTRAAQSQCNTNMPASFKVSAFKTGSNAVEDYFTGDIVNKNGGSANTYTPATLRFWPQYDLDFYAWTNDDGTYSRNAEDGTQQFVDFAPKDDVKEQLDLLYAVQPAQSHEERRNVKLNFRHALSQIVFAARNESRLNISIKGVEVSHLYTSNTYTLGNLSTQENYENHEELPGVDDNREGLGSWAEFEANAALGNYAVDFDRVDITDRTVDLTSVNHKGGPDMSMILLPQTQERWTPGNAAGVKDREGYNGFYFTLDLAIYDGAKEVYTGKALVPAQINWKQGVRYKYTFVFTDHGNSGYQPGDPDNPTEVLAGISYDLTTDDFVPYEKDVNINVQPSEPGDDSEFDNLSYLEKYYFTIAGSDYSDGGIPYDSYGISLGDINMSTEVMSGAMNYVTITTGSDVSRLYFGVKGIDGYLAYSPVSSGSGSNTFVIPMMISYLYSGDATFLFSGLLDNGELTDVYEVKVTYLETIPGAIEVKLSFSNSKDIDLHLYTPSGEHIYFGNRGGTFTDGLGHSITYGLDVDSNAMCRIDNINKENIYIPKELVEDGVYTVVVDMYSNCNPSIATSWSVVTRYQGRLITPTFGVNPASGVYPVGAGRNDQTKIMTFRVSDSLHTRSGANNDIRSTWDFTPTPLTESDKDKLDFLMD